MKRFFAVFLALSLLCGLAACGKEESAEPAAPAAEATPQPMAEAVEPDPSAEGAIRIYAPGAEAGWTESAALYTALTGIPAELTDSMDAATLLCVDYGTMQTLESRAAALDECAAVSRLSVRAYAYRNAEEHVLGLPLMLESVGVAVNTELLEKAGYSMERLDGFKALRRFSTSVNDRKDDLGFSSWAPMALADEGAERLGLYLFNMPIRAELEDFGRFTGKYVGDYNDAHYKDLFTVMLDFGTKTGGEVNSVTLDESLSVFAEGGALFCLVDSGDLGTLANKGMDLSKLDFVPAWMFLPNDESWGFVTDATLYAAICADSEQDRHAAEDFFYWCLTDAAAMEKLSSVYDGLPYEGFTPGNPMLAKNAANDAAGLSAVPWLHRQISDVNAWNETFLNGIRTITPDNAVWRWQTMFWVLADLWNAQ